jgi:hypothetical protein
MQSNMGRYNIFMLELSGLMSQISNINADIDTEHQRTVAEVLAQRNQG